MIWYKFEIRYGGGHMETATKYEAFDHEPSYVALEHTFNRLVNEHGLRNARCTPERLGDLPADIRNSLIRGELQKVAMLLEGIRKKFTVPSIRINQMMRKIFRRMAKSS